MHSLLRIIAGPLIGAVIGYITNYIAIKMLFRPLEAKYFLGVHIPFTPGIIPRRKPQLATALGKAVFAKFFNWDDLEEVFLSDSFASEVAERISIALHTDRPVGEILKDMPTESADAITRQLAVRMRDSLVESGMIRKVAMQSSGAGSLADRLAGAYAGPIAERVEQFLNEQGEEQIVEMLREEGKHLSREPLADLLGRAFPREEVLREGIKNVYLRFIREHVRPIVESIDIVTQITGKMNQMSSGEVESLVLDIVSRELRMVVWFGAFLGAMIGVVNIFI